MRLISINEKRFRGRLINCSIVCNIHSNSIEIFQNSTRYKSANSIYLSSTTCQTDIKFSQSVFKHIIENPFCDPFTRITKWKKPYFLCRMIALNCSNSKKCRFWMLKLFFFLRISNEYVFKIWLVVRFMPDHFAWKMSLFASIYSSINES